MHCLVSHAYLHAINGYSPAFVCVSLGVHMYVGNIPNYKLESVRI